MKKEYFCTICSQTAKERELIAHTCPDYLVECRLLLNRYDKFLMWLYGLDIFYWLAFASGTIINALAMAHSNWQPTHQFIESICIGFILMRILKNG